MIKVIQITDTQHPDRINSIYQSIFTRASKYHNKNYKSKYKDVVFENLIYHKNKNFIKEYKIKVIPTTLFFKNNQLVKTAEGIMATAHILQILEEI